MIELNLLPDIKQEFVQARRQKRVVIAGMILTSIISVALVVLLGFYAYAAQTLRQKLADDTIASKSKELKSQKNLVRNLTIQNQLSSIDKLHEAKPVYQRLFDYLKVLNPEAPNNVSISKVTILTTEDGSNALLIEASAKDYQAVTVFKDTLENAQLVYVDPDSDSKAKTKTPLFSSVVLSDTGIGKDSSGKQVASFKATVIYEPDAFAWTVKDPTIQVPNKKTNQSASNVFADAPVKKETQ
ncbi:MAG: hypothetical protein Q7T74_01800 [Candidatus Saccharibacteria bacterium]|nr:hypothetical protein [Candidatus Saccharibacteria bacterium]